MFEHNDRPGVLLASAAQRLIHLEKCRLDGPVVVVTDNPHGYRTAKQLRQTGTEIAQIVDGLTKIANLPLSSREETSFVSSHTSRPSAARTVSPA